MATDPIVATSVDEGELLEALRGAGADVTACYQCGRCSVGCPVSEFFDLKPMQVVRLCCYGEQERLLSCRTIWLCASCETCTTRCPNGIDIAGMMDVLRGRVIAKRQKAAMPRVFWFHKAFLQSIRFHGRIHEMEMIGLYKLFSGDYFSDMGLGLEMFKRGKLNFFPHRIKGTREVRRLFKKQKET